MWVVTCGCSEMKIMRYLASPGHPGIMTISHILEDPSNYYCVMPCFSGVCVQYVVRMGPPPCSFPAVPCFIPTKPTYCTPCL